MRSFEEYWYEHGDVYAMEIAENVWDYQQSKIDELTLQVAEMKSRLNDAYTDGQSAMYVARQSKIDELNQELHLVLNNWNDLTNAIHARTNGTAVAEARQLYEKVDELQKRMDAALIKLDKRWNESWSNWKEKADMYEQGAANAFEEAYWLLEQALKGCDRKISQELSLSELRGNNV